jgi:hypothetical protein
VDQVEKNLANAGQLSLPFSCQIFQALTAAGYQRDENGRWSAVFRVNHRRVCRKAWGIANGYSEDRVKAQMASIRSGHKFCTKKMRDYHFAQLAGGGCATEGTFSKHAAFDSPLVTSTCAWLDNYAATMGCRIPTQRDSNADADAGPAAADADAGSADGGGATTYFRLPHFYWMDIWIELAFEKKSRGLDWPSYGYFTQIRSARRPWLMLQRSKGSHPTCSDCVRYRAKLLRLSLSVTERERITCQRARHLHQAYAERMYYYGKIDLALRFPSMFMSIIMDCMDQRKLQLPHFTRLDQTHLLQGAKLLKQILMGVYVHGRGIHCYAGNPKWGTGGGADFTAECLMRTLARYGPKLPPYLFLQMDNCAGDNKNRAMLALACWLVHTKVCIHMCVCQRPCVPHPIICISRYSNALRLASSWWGTRMKI